MKFILIISLLLLFAGCSEFTTKRSPSSITPPLYWIQNGVHAGERAIKFHKNFYLWQSGSNWQEINYQSIDTSYPTLTTRQKWRSFLSESKKIIDLSENNLTYATISYKKFFNKTKKKLQCFSGKNPDDEILSLAINQLQTKLPYQSEKKVESIERVVTQLKSIWLPPGQNKNFWDETLVVPLSVAWFESDPELKQFWEEKWLHSGMDIRILAGNSGEGVGKGSEGYQEMKDLLEMTSLWLLEHKKQKIAQTAEAQWLLKHQVKINSEEYLRLIFISQNTWNNLEEPTDYADYVMVNQQISFVPAFPFFSLILHEANVNSGTTALFPADTHLNSDKSVEVLKESQLPTDYEGITYALQIQPELSLVQLASFLNELEKSGSCD